MLRQSLRDDAAGERTQDDRRKRANVISADDQLECIERTGKRRIESRRNRAGRAAADEGPKVIATRRSL